MIDEREIVRRAVEQLAPPEPSFERLSRRRDRRQRNRRIGSAVVALVVVGATVAGLVQVLSSHTTVPGDLRTPFLGAWERTDADGGTQTMTVRVVGNVAIAITVRDDAAAACAGAPSTITGTGRLAGSEEFVIPSPAFTCDDGSDPGVQEPPLEEQLRNLTFVLDVTTSRLTDSLGLVWKRPRGNPSPDPSASDLGIFAGVRGWIAYGDPYYGEPLSSHEPGIWAIDPANPNAEPVLLDPDGGVPLAWSSDGSKLLILRGGRDARPGSHSNLLVLDANGTETPLAVHVGYLPGGSFTPDGSQVVYQWEGGIYSVDAGGGSRRLIYQGDSVFVPVLSPDGARLAFFEGRGDAENRLWVMNVDGTDKRPILGWNEAGRTPWSLQWSPDGTRLAFKRGADRSFGIVNADGSGLAFFGVGVSDLGPGAGPYWSPDGTRLAFATGYWKSPSLAIARPDGTDLHELSVGRAGPWNPVDPRRG
ncbi:MAG: TolB family protein [Actinomycetota bacterium]